MELLHPEIEVIPGRLGARPQTTPVRKEQPLPGSAVVRVTNNTNQENAFTIKLTCEQPYWDESWYTVVSLPPAPGEQNAIPAGKQDQRGPQDRWVKIYVPRGGTRDILIRFNVQARPESRAGRYQYTVEIERQVVGPAESGRRQDRMVLLRAIANVRPFYKWSVDFAPEERRVGRLRRSAEFDVVVTNEGNDWLYCDLRFAKPKDMLIENPAIRLAVPPPEPGEMLPSRDQLDSRPGTQRTTPIKTITRLKTFRGTDARQPIPLTAQRVDAPSLPPPPAEGYVGMGAVVANSTSDTQPAPPERVLVYRPPVPAKLTDFFSHTASNIRTWIFTVIGLIVLVPAAILAYNYAVYNFTVQAGSAAYPGKPFTILGKGVILDKVIMTPDDGSVPPSPPIQIGHKPGAAVTNVNVGQFIVPKNLDHKVCTIQVLYLADFLQPFSKLFPGTIHNIQVGDALQPLAVTSPVNATVNPGGSFDIPIQGGTGSGTVTLNGTAVPAQWASDKVSVTVPKDMPAGQLLTVNIVPAGGGASVPAGGVTVASAVVANAGHGGGGGAPQQHPQGGGGGGGGAPQQHPQGGGGGGGGAPQQHPQGGGGGGAPQQHPQGGGAPQQHPQQQPQGGGGGGPVKIYHPETPQTQIGTMTPIGRPGQAAYDDLLHDNYAQAVTDTDAFLAREPGSGAGYAYLAYAYAKQGNAAAAQTAIQQARQVADSGNSRVQALTLIASGAVEENAGDSNAALKAFESAIKTDKSLGLAYLAYSEYWVDPKFQAMPDREKILLQMGVKASGGEEGRDALQAKLKSLP